MATFPLVSVIVPVYNGAATLPACLDGLAAQAYPADRFEVIVVDNGSTDATASVARAAGVRVLHETDIQSSYAARNRGIRHAKGRLFAFTDADCVPAPDWLMQAVPAFEDATVGAVGGAITGGAPRTWVEAQLVAQGWLSEHGGLQHPYRPFPQTANAIYRREVFDAVGLFEARWISGGDADLAWRMQAETNWRVRHVPAAAVEHRHRTDLRGLYRQCKKWGHGHANLARRYGIECVRPALRSPTATLRFLVRTSASLVVQVLWAAARGRTFAKAPHYLILLTTRAGEHIGFLRGRRAITPGPQAAQW
ncbi:glycosyltransferase [Salisaeta longa]|uniref:glycosyltransferase n=1 Tax=Salisaeta longa TaxID=503170 RepID=UPI0003B5CFBA|nr:glycosyltransferase [Salisaeta longa]